MGTPKYGLPTSLDDEVLVGLIQMTKRRSNFTDQKVAFSRYELIELLGWPQSGQSYKRIEEALRRPPRLDPVDGLAIEFDNAGAPYATVCTVSGPDRPGVLETVFAAFARAADPRVLTPWLTAGSMLARRTSNPIAA